MQKIIIGLTGASGIIYGIRLLKILSTISDIETHLVISKAGKQTLHIETSYNINDVQKMANFVYDNQNITANIASGSFITSGMIILPCSIKTLSGINSSYNDTLIVRAADVVLKERRKLILGVRETPLHSGHLNLMLNITNMGGIIFPPLPAFYHKPITIENIIDQTINRILDQYGINLTSDLFARWSHK